MVAMGPSRYSKLQNGSDVRGVALGKPEAVTLTANRVRNIAHAFAKILKQRAGKEGTGPGVRIGVGRDSRVTGRELCDEAMRGIADAGLDCAAFDLGLATTPAMYMSTITEGFEYSGSIMLTASHLPYDRNGMKFFTPDGGLAKSDITEILDAAEKVEAEEAGGDLFTGPDQLSSASFMPTYASILRSHIIAEVGAGDAPLAGLKIVVDAGNGAGGFFAKDVLEPLGADVSGSQFLEPDGMFPNHVPNPEDADAMRSIQRAVSESNADLGVIFDTDVDRSAVVDSKGMAFNKNRLIAAMSAITLRDSPGGTVVTDSVTSDALTDFIESRGGRHLRFKRGYKNVIEKGKEINNCPLMIETSGHGAMAENHYLDDGAYMAVKMIIEAARRKGDLAGLVDGFEEPVEALEKRVRFGDGAPEGYGTLVVEDFRSFCKGGDAPEGWVSADSNHEGWRVSVLSGGVREGWVLIRQSLHDPLLVVNAESNAEGGVERYMKVVEAFLDKYEHLS